MPEKSLTGREKDKEKHIVEDNELHPVRY